jgi:outer membrane protein assembly factor BamD (BamD/ComL family)
MLRGDLRSARVQFGRLEEALRIGELAELARFELARLDFYEGHFASALTLVEALDENTSTDIANDAIEIKVLLRENQGPDSLSLPLRMFAEAQLLRRQRQPHQALSTLDTLLARYPDHKLSDEVAFLRAGLLADLGDYQQAIESYRRVESEHAGSYLADRSIFEVAELYETRLGDVSSAKNAYGDLLLKYPGSMLAAEVRARMRRLREKNVSL